MSRRFNAKPHRVTARAVVCEPRDHNYESSSFPEMRNHTLDLLSTVSSVADTPLLVLLCGIPGSGKSTFCRELLRTANDNSTEESTRCWEHFNQDVLGSRGAVLSCARLALQRGSSVCIDRCNFDVAQRATWLQLAMEHEALVVCVLPPHFHDLYVCTERAVLRGADGVHDTETNWYSVCRTMHRSFVFPSLDEEGLSAIFPCESDSDREQILSALVGFPAAETSIDVQCSVESTTQSTQKYEL